MAGRGVRAETACGSCARPSDIGARWGALWARTASGRSDQYLLVLSFRRFNPSAQKTLNLIPSDTGRSIRDLSLTLAIKDLDAMIASVIDTLEVREVRVEDREGHVYLLRIRPYKTADNKIDGAVLVMIDLDQLKKKG